MYNIRYTAEAYRDFKRIPDNILKTIFQKLNVLAENPYAMNNNIKKLTNQNAYRLRVGDYRVVYKLENDELVIVVVRVAHRREVYQ
jgi:mRNA interferase RelE/StbE